MIDSIRGQVRKKLEDKLILDNRDISYLIYMSGQSLSQISLNTEVSVYIEMIVREDSINLYGFATEEERDIYRLLTTVKSIGPKTAIGILSSTNSNSIVLAIKNEDANTLSKAPGIGKKTAERIILELKDKIDHIQVVDENPSTNILAQAREGLVQLGYSPYEVSGVLEGIYEDGMDIEELIRLGLQQMLR